MVRYNRIQAKTVKMEWRKAAMVNSDDLVVKVPVGTIIYDNSTSLLQFLENGQRAIIAKGGRGGRKYPLRKHLVIAPELAENGELFKNPEVRVELSIS